MSLVATAPPVNSAVNAREYYKGLMMILMMTTTALYNVHKLMHRGKVSHVL